MNFGDFTDGGMPSVNDYLVGYATPGAAGSDRRWLLNNVFETLFAKSNEWGGANTLITSETNVSPSLNTYGYLEIVNINTATGSGAQLWFGSLKGNPYVTLSSWLTSGPSPYQGRLVFAIKPGLSLPRENVLWLTEGGTLFSGSDPDNALALAAQTANFSALADDGQQCFIGYTNTAANPSTTGCAAGYFVAENDDAIGGAVSAWAMYAEGRAGNFQFTVGAEIDVQNTSGLVPRTIAPYTIFGSGSNPLAVAIWSQADGSKVVTPKDASACIAIVKSGLSCAFQKGIVVEDGAIASVSSHKEAIAFPASNEIVWYSSSTERTRLSSNGISLFLTGTGGGTGGLYLSQAAFMLHTTTSWTDGAAGQTATLTNAPAATNPTKWIPVDDNGTTRYIPAW